MILPVQSTTAAASNDSVMTLRIYLPKPLKFLNF